MEVDPQVFYVVLQSQWIAHSFPLLHADFILFNQAVCATQKQQLFSIKAIFKIKEQEKKKNILTLP